MRSRQLHLDQLGGVLDPLARIDIPAPPPTGWLRAVREALGMSARQLAERVGVQVSTLLGAERNEASGSISLRQLRRVADALDCDVRYVLVPRSPLRERVERRAEALAREEVGHVAHTMALEAQGTGDEFARRQVDEIKTELLRGRWSRLWRERSH